MRRGKHSAPLEIQDGPEVGDLGRGSMIRFGNQRFRIDPTALLGNLEISFQRENIADDWEITIMVAGHPLMGEMGALHTTPPDEDEVHYADGRVVPFSEIMSAVNRTIPQPGTRVGGIWIPQQ